MRIIKNESDYKNKFGDTNTVFRLNLYDDETLVDTTNKSLKLNIANDKGLVLSKDIKTDYSGYIAFDFSDESIQKLTPDNYLLEIELPIDGEIAKYPTTGGLRFVVTKSLNETTGKLVNTITFDEVLTAVDKKIAVYLATVKKGDKGDPGVTGQTGQTGQNGKDGKDSDVMQSKNNTFTGNNTFTQPINGALNTRPATFTDFNDLAANLSKYQGLWNGGYDRIANSPEKGWFIINIILWSSKNNLGYIILHYTDHNAVWFGLTINGKIQWSKKSDDSTVVHNTGDENADGIKTFTKQIIASGGIKGDLIGNATTANDPNAVHKTGDETVSGNKTFTGTTNTTGYLKQKRWSTTVSIGGNTFILKRIGDIVFVSSTATTKLVGGTTASGTLPTGFRPFANSVITAIRGTGFSKVLFQKDGSVYVSSTVNVASYISGTYLAEDTLPTI